MNRQRWLRVAAMIILTIGSLATPGLHAQVLPAMALPDGGVLLLIYRDSNGPGTAMIAMERSGAEAAGSSPTIRVSVLQNGIIFHGNGLVERAESQSIAIRFSLGTDAGDLYQYEGSLAGSGDAWSGQGWYQSISDPSVTGRWSTVGVLIQSAPARPVSSLQAVVGPTAVAVPPQGHAILVVGGHSPATAAVNNHSDQPAAAADDGSVLTILAPPGFIIATDQDCEPIDGAFNAVRCPPTLLVTFTTVPAGTAAQPLPQTVTLLAPSAGNLVAPAPVSAPSSQRPPAIVAVRAMRDCCSDPVSLNIDWDGQVITINAPVGYRPQAANSSDCSPSTDAGNVVSCPETGIPPRLIEMASVGPPRHPPGTPPGLFLGPLQIGPSNVAAGQPVTLSVSSRGGGGEAPSYIWSFGDDSLGSGQTVVHVYSVPGAYTVTLTAFFPSSQGGYGVAHTTATVDVGMPP